MKALRTLVVAGLTGLALITTSCSVMRGQETTGAYVDDAGITAAVKAKLIDSDQVDAGAVHVDTLHGEVALSGFAKSADEKTRAGALARSVKGVTAVHNNLIVR